VPSRAVRPGTSNIAGQKGYSDGGRTSRLVDGARTTPAGSRTGTNPAREGTEHTTINQLETCPAAQAIIAQAPEQKTPFHSLRRGPRKSVSRQAGAVPGLTIPDLVAFPKSRQRRDGPETRHPEFPVQRGKSRAAQLCGLGTLPDAGLVTVLSPDEFQKWGSRPKGGKKLKGRLGQTLQVETGQRARSNLEPTYKASTGHSVLSVV